MLSNKNYENQSSLLLDSITSNTNATFNNSSFTGLLTLPSGQIVSQYITLVDLNSEQTLTNKTISQYSNIDNTSDLEKPISTATLTALNLKAPLQSPSFTGTVTLPSTQTITSTTTLVDTNSVQTLTNKTFNLASPTFTGTVTLPSTQTITSTTTLVDTDSTQTLTNKSFDINLPTSYYSPTSTQLGYIMYGTTTSTNNIILSSTVSTQLYTLTLPAGVWLVSGQIEYFCYSTASLSFSQISSSIYPNAISNFTNNLLYSIILPSGTLTTNNSIIQQIQGVFNINATPTLNNNVLNLITTSTFSTGNVLVKCVSVTTASVTSGATTTTTVVISSNNAGIVVGMKITGNGITVTPPIVTAKSGTTITMSTAQTISASTVLTFTNTAGNTFLYAVRVG